jgi:DNA-binding GntR family transcriptional regulator
MVICNRLSISSMPQEYSKLILTSHNNLLNHLDSLTQIPCDLPAVSTIGENLKISRTTVRKILDILCQKGMIREDGSNKILLRKPLEADYLTAEENVKSKSDQVEKQILEKLSAYSLRPGDRFSELELAREFNSNTVITREALLRIAKSGIIKKHPHQKWEVIEFSPELINEIASLRTLYEGFAIRSMESLNLEDPIWDKFKSLRKRHENLLTQVDISVHDMQSIEKDFHMTIILATHNRFIESSYDAVFTLIVFHLWQISYDRIKIEKVLLQHVSILEALIDRNFDKAGSELNIHLDHAKDSMRYVNSQLLASM